MIDRVIDALRLPASALIGQRIHKTVLVEHATVTAADKRAIDAGFDRIDWVATLKPAGIGVPGYSDDARVVEEVAVITARLRGDAKPARLAALLHRVIPYPVLLVLESGENTMLSLAPKRRSLGDAAKWVVEDMVTAPPLIVEDDPQQSAFLVSLAVASLPHASLWLLYAGLIERAEAFAAARATGQFRLTVDADDAAARRAALAAHAGRVAEVARLRTAARRESRVAEAIALARAVAAAEAALAETLAALK